MLPPSLSASLQQTHSPKPRPGTPSSRVTAPRWPNSKACGQIVRTHATAVVDDAQTHRRAWRVGRTAHEYLYRARGRSETHGIVEQVRHDLPHLAPIGPSARHPALLHTNLHARTLRRDHPAYGDEFLSDLIEMHHTERGRRRAAVRTSHCRQRWRSCLRVAPRCARESQVLPLLPRELAGTPVEHDREQREHDRERGTQLMPHVRLALARLVIVMPRRSLSRRQAGRPGRPAARPRQSSNVRPRRHLSQRRASQTSS